MLKECKHHASKLGWAVMFCLPLLGSCKDDYVYDDGEPGWLGANIYEYLESSGKYNTYLTLVRDLGYEETLRRTGSKTVFPATDEAYDRYFRENGYAGTGAGFVHTLSEYSKRYLFNTSILNMAYLSHMLPNIQDTGTGIGEGQALRRTTSSTYLDSVLFIPYEQLPQNGFWYRFKEKGGAHLADYNDRNMVMFTPQYFSTRGITEADWNVISKGWNMPYEKSGLYINGSHVAAGNKDVTCKNGYLHLPDQVVAPISNMAEIINNDPKVSVFAQLMEKFAYPTYDGTVNRNLTVDNPGRFQGDSAVFIKRYFNLDDFYSDPDGKLDIPGYGYLQYDPANNSWGGLTDMGMMFVPTNAAMQEYWNSEAGAFLKDRYASWDDVPTSVVGAFLQNHQQRSFSSSLPHNWHIMANMAGYEMGMKEEYVEQATLGCNGVVFRTNKVFPPVDYQSVYAPTLVSDLTTVMKAAIKNDDEGDINNLKYHFFLRSLDNQYSLLVPTDEAMKNYRDPLTWALWANEGTDKREIWSFGVLRGKVVAEVYGVNADGTKGELLRSLNNVDNSSHMAEVANRVRDIMEMHIVVADNETQPLSAHVDNGAQPMVISKGNSLLRVSGTGKDVKVSGASDEEPATVVTLDDGNAGRYVMDNGRAFFIDRILQDSYRSVYKAMQDQYKVASDASATGEANCKFFQLCMGDERVFSFFQDDDTVQPIFDLMQTSSTSGLGPVVTSFSNYRYTVLVPTDEAIDAAFASDPKLWSWERIAAETDAEVKRERTLYLLNFLRFHFIDGILPVAGVPFSGEYSTAARDKSGHFVYVAVQGDGQSLSVSYPASGEQTHVITSDPAKYNVMTRDFIVNNKDYTKATQITASSKAVIHAVDLAIDYQKQ